MSLPTELLPVVQITLPLMLTIFGAMYIGLLVQNKRFDDLRSDMNRQFDEIKAELRAIRSKFENHGERIAMIEGRTNPPIVRR